MLQAILRKGKVLAEEMPSPVVSDNRILIKVVYSCISIGTEISSVTTNNKNVLRQALEQPEKVKKFLNMAREEGIKKAWNRLVYRLDIGQPLGYSLAGIVVGVGSETTQYRVGDIVAAAGAGYANHAEFVEVPENLVTAIGENIPFLDASTVALGAIAMQGVRRMNARLGEFVVVFGTGLIGLLTTRLLVISGVRVVAVDLSDDRLKLAIDWGAEYALNLAKESVKTQIKHLTNECLADGILFCASTSDSKSLSEAFGLVRKKGKVVMLGIWGDRLNRDDIYLKELDFLMSTSYGPGRNDPNYEKNNYDYPYAYVRWTQGRNMAEYIRLLATRKVNLPIKEREIFRIEEVEQAYKRLQQQPRPLLLFLNYDGKIFSDKPDEKINYSIYKLNKINRINHKKIKVGIIGAGAFMQSVHLPNLITLDNKFMIRSICNRTGSTAQELVRKYDADYGTTNPQDIFDDNEVDLVMIGTRHDSHGQLAIRSLESGKNTFVEKPLCLRMDELEKIVKIYSNTNSNKFNSSLLMVGFNRRFSPYAIAIKRALDVRINPAIIIYRMNVDFISKDHWIHKKEEGGGRIIGESCHIIDLFSYLIGSPVKTISTAQLHSQNNHLLRNDNLIISFEYEDGSTAVLIYYSCGSERLSKERFEVHFDGKSILVDDYKRIKGFGVRVAEIYSAMPNKGHYNELETLAECLISKNSIWPIPLSSLIETTRISYEIEKSCETV